MRAAPTDRRPAICKHWFAWEQSKLLITSFPAICCAACVSVLLGYLLFMWFSDKTLVIFCKSTRRRSLPFSFLGAKLGLALMLNDRVVMIPNLCKNASSIVTSSSRLIGVGRF